MGIIGSIQEFARLLDRRIFPPDQFCSFCLEKGFTKYNRKEFSKKEQFEIEYIINQIGEYLNYLKNTDSIYFDPDNMYLNCSKDNIFARAINFRTERETFLSIQTHLNSTPIPNSSYYQGLFKSGRILEDSGKYFGMYGDGEYFSFTQITPEEIVGD